MKKQILLIAALFLTAWATAQTQQGYVKTKGRLANDGSVIAGTRIPYATIQVKDRTPVVSQTDGAFSFPIPADKFYLQSVQKQGFVLTDPDILSKEHTYSTNDLVLVMETPTNQWQDKYAAEKAMRKQLQRQVDEQRLELERLKEKQCISDEEYRERLQRIFELYDENDKLVSEMAEAYAKIDYDQLDEHNRLIRQYILAGELKRADSLIHSKGDMGQRIDEFHRHQEANAKEAATLAKRQEQLEAAKAGTQKELEDIAQDCYNLFEICKMQHLNDSAAYWIELRAELDTTHVEWINDAGCFLFRYMADNSKSLSFFQMALRQINKKTEKESYCAGTIYNNIGLVYSRSIGDYDKALEFYEKALTIEETTFGKNHPDVAASYNNIGVVYYHHGDFEKALEYFNMALTILESYSGDSNPDIATLFDNMGNIYSDYNDLEKGLELLKKALFIRETSYGTNHPDVADSYNNIGAFYHDQRDYDKALEYFNKALTIRKTVLGENHPDVADSYNNIATAYKMQYNFEKAWVYYQKALDIGEATYGAYSNFTATCYDNIGTLYYDQDNFEQALVYINQSLSIRNVILKENHPNIAKSYNALGKVYSTIGDFDNARYYLSQALTIQRAIYGDNNNLIAKNLNSIALLCYKMGDYNSALDYLNQALDIRKAIYGENHPITIDQQEQISTCKYWIAVKKGTVNAFFEEHCITATVANDETEAAKQGMSGEYVLLEFEDWKQDSLTSVFDKNEELKGKPKDILVIKDGIVEKHHFENIIGIIFSAKYIGKEEKQRIDKAYEEWKVKN